MHNHKKTGFFIIITHYFTSFLALFFWLLLIFAFDTPYTATVTLFAAIVHESGHKIAFSSVHSISSAPSPRLFGFKITPKLFSSYNCDIIGALGGPMANLALCILGLPLLIIENEAYTTFAVVNLATAGTNLLPIKGYDGYKILSSLMLKKQSTRFYINIIDVFSFTLISLLTFTSLYLIAKLNEGYWIFIVFFSALIAEGFKSPYLIKNEG